MRGSLLIWLAAFACLGQLTGCGGGDGTSPPPAAAHDEQVKLECVRSFFSFWQLRFAFPTE